MSIIQTIREKGAVIVIAVIAISLIGFILMDSMSGTGKLFGGGDQTTIGIVNGEKILYPDFNEKVKQVEQQYGNVPSEQRNQLMQSTWDQMVAEKIVNEQFENLGLVFTPKEMSATMFSEDAPQQLKQAFTDKQTGQYDIEQAKQWWAQVKQNKNKDQRTAILNEVIDPMILNSLYTKYTSMISASVYQPKWMKAMNQQERSQYAMISYVAVPYTSISDSTIKVTDADIKDYINKHKKSFDEESGVMLSYVSFSAAPSTEDSNHVREVLTELKTQFVSDSNAKFFLGRNSSSISYFDGYTPGSKMQTPFKDSVISLPKNGVFGPYIDGNNYVLAKKVDQRILPDSFKVRHILLGTMDPKTQQPLMTDSVAKRIADSVATAIKNGADFNTLEEKYSTDEGARQTNGVMTFDIMTVQGNGFAKEFANFLMNEKGESKGVVKTEFGYHYIEIMEKIHPEESYKIAYMAREIVPSDATINNANSEAVKLAASARDLKSFNEYVAKNGLKKIDLPEAIHENDFQLGSYPDARTIVKWAFDAKEGAVSDPFSIKDDFVVAVVDKRVKKGTPDVETARPLVEPIIRNEKKAEEIKKKMGKSSSLESIAKALQLQVLTTGEDSTLTFNASLINGIGSEPLVAGASFNKDYQSKISPAIPGNTGVFVIKVNSVRERTIPQEQLSQQLSADHNRLVQNALQQSFAGLKKASEIKDYRSKFF